MLILYQYMGKNLIDLNVIALVFILLAIVTHYIDFWLGISNNGNSISVGLLASGTTLINFQAQKDHK